MPIIWKANKVLWIIVSSIFSQDGFVKFSWKFGGEKTLSDLDHCRVVLRALAHFHAYSTVIQVTLLCPVQVLYGP